MTPYYEDDLTTLYHGDCLDVLPSLPSADMIFTSPPYNLGGKPWANLGNWKQGDSKTGASKWRNGSDGVGGMTYDATTDAMPWGEYEHWQRTILTACWDRLSERGAIFYNHKPRVIGAKLWLPLTLNPDLPLRQIVVWARPGGMNFNPTAYVPTHEWVMIFAKPAWRLKSRAASGPGDVWRFAPARSKHPAPFPVELPATAIETAAPSLVIDPFAGSGTTLVAAKAAGVRSIGIDISEAYCEMAATRISQGVLDFTEATA